MGDGSFISYDALHCMDRVDCKAKNSRPRRESIVPEVYQISGRVFS